MLDILKSLKKIIERYIVNMIQLTEPANRGDTIVTCLSARRFCLGDGIVVYNKPSPSQQSEGEVHTVVGFGDERGEIEIDSPLISNYPLENSFVEKILGFE